MGGVMKLCLGGGGQLKHMRGGEVEHMSDKCDARAEGIGGGLPGGHPHPGERSP
jgi:hypothetical protein